MLILLPISHAILQCPKKLPIMLNVMLVYIQVCMNESLHTTDSFRNVVCFIRVYGIKIRIPYALLLTIKR